MWQSRPAIRTSNIRKRSLRFRFVGALTVFCMAGEPCSVLANPKGAQVVGGSANINGENTPHLIVNQSSDRTIINWNSFNISAGETTQFIQPNSSSVALNRVTGGSPSSIFGTLTANGRVFLINPEGVIFGPSANINTAGFLATTNNITDKDFMAGNYAFGIPGNPRASIINQGRITVTDAGLAALVAPGVRNDGIIMARLGHIELASANEFALDFYGDDLIKFSVSDNTAMQAVDVSTGLPIKNLVENTGTLEANGGIVALTAVTAKAVVDSAISNNGVIEAQSVDQQDGEIILSAQTADTKTPDAPAQNVLVSGTLDASGNGVNETGGKIQITGEDITLKSATLDASGNAGGGKILVGGDYHGGQPDSVIEKYDLPLEPAPVPNASKVTVDNKTKLDASAIYSGNGGKTVIWSNDETDFAGTLLSKGGANGGNGGFVEVSSHDLLKFTGLADLGAAKGNSGTLLLDPLDLFITGDASVPETGASGLTASEIEAQLANDDVILSTDNSTGAQAGDITVASPISWSSDHILNLDAYHSIMIASPIAVNGLGGLIFTTNDGGTGGTLSFPGGNVTYASLLGGLIINGNFYKLEDNLPSLAEDMAINPNGYFALAKSYDASKDGAYSNTPLGNFEGFAFTFNGTFEGLGNTISNLTAAYGLFNGIGQYGLVENLGLTNETITGIGDTGGLASDNEGTIQQVYTTGAINSACCYVGGLVGYNAGAIKNSFSTASVSDDNTNGGEGNQYSYVGGLVGWQNGSGSILNSYATGNISSLPSFWPANSSTAVGGLVGRNEGEIGNAYATGNITGARGSFGGLVGQNFGTIDYAFATGDVTGDYQQYYGIDFFIAAGGLIGQSNFGVTNNSFSTGNVRITSPFTLSNGVPYNDSSGSAGIYAGSFVGWSGSSAVNNSYATGNVNVESGLYFLSSTSIYVGNFFGIGSTALLSSSGASGTAADGNYGINIRNQNTYTLSNFTVQNYPSLIPPLSAVNTLSAGSTDQTWNVAADRNSGQPYLWWQYPPSYASQTPVSPGNNSGGDSGNAGSSPPSSPGGTINPGGSGGNSNTSHEIGGGQNNGNSDNSPADVALSSSLLNQTIQTLLLQERQQDIADLMKTNSQMQTSTNFVPPFPSFLYPINFAFDPNSSPEDAKSYSNAGESINDDTDSSADFSQDQPGWHDYTVGPDLICSAAQACSREEIIDQMSRYAVPGQDPSKSVINLGIYHVYDPRTGIYAGNVITTVTNQGFTITNRTLPGHLFYDGEIIRTAVQIDGAWYITTHGFGNNVILGANIINEWQGKKIFEYLDKEMQNNIATHHQTMGAQ